MIITTAGRLRVLQEFSGMWHPFCDDIAGIIFGGHEFPHADSADVSDAFLCGGEGRRAVSGGG